MVDDASRPYTPLVEPVIATARRRRRDLLIVAALLAVAVTAGIRSVDAYAPLEAGSTSQAPAESQEGSAFGPDPTDPPAYQVRYRHGATTTLAFTVRNGGRWGVTIVDLPILHQTGFFLINFTDAETSEAMGTVGPFRPFAPFALAPGEERLIRLTGTFTDCQWHTPGAGNSFDSMEVAYRFLWSTDRVRIPLPFELEVVSPPQAECPAPPEYRSS